MYMTLVQLFFYLVHIILLTLCSSKDFTGPMKVISKYCLCQTLVKTHNYLNIC